MAASHSSKRDQRRREREFQKNYAKSRAEQAATGAHHSPLRRLAPRILFVVAVVIAAQHLIFHAANGSGRAALIEDVFFGYPMAALVAIAAAFLLPASRSK